MKIELKEITVADLVEGYADDNDEGVIGYGGRLDIRPKYQRAFVYKDTQRNAVIDTLSQGFPLNVMYWAVRDGDNFEVIDGQQRTISIAQYVQGDFSVNNLYFENLQSDIQKQLLDYKLTVYLCTGTDSEKLAWFRTINIAGEKLTDQELRNAVYSGSWVTKAKKYFSSKECAASSVGKDYLKGRANRQEHLETAIKWINNGKIEEYMAQHQNDEDAEPLWGYFQKVIAWVKQVFPEARKEMNGLDWGVFYNDYKDEEYDPEYLETEVARLMEDEDVHHKKGIYQYLLTGEERHLNIRTFDDKHKREAYERQGGVCPSCSERFDIEEMEGDHIKPWSKGGKTQPDNCQMLCTPCNRSKSNK